MFETETRPRPSHAETEMLASPAEISKQYVIVTVCICSQEAEEGHGYC